MAARMDCAGSTNNVIHPNPNATSDIAKLLIFPTIGGAFELHIATNDCIEGLKRIVAKRLRLPKERIHLLFKEKLLKEGTLFENGISDGSKLTLLPTVESGLSSQRTEQSVLQALEHLSDSQVDDFLTGKSPLTLMMRLGDHMMFVELQLSTTSHNFRRNADGSPNNSLPVLDSMALAQASRNLSKKLKELSTTYTQAQCPVASPSCDECETSRTVPGAVIESMRHHGQGVFSGTFSGTLNPALQDTDGRPRKNINTIVHILNDLLGATHTEGQCFENTPETTTEKTAEILHRTVPLPKQCSQHLQGGYVMEEENTTTRTKMQRLQVMLEERRTRRRSRRQANNPYQSWHTAARQKACQEQDNINSETYPGSCLA